MPTAHLVKAFTKNKNEGNPAGVIFEADDLTDEEMIAISAQLGFSESAFVQKSDKADFKIRFFTPREEVDLCGHATIATFHALAETGRITMSSNGVTKVQESRAGLLPVTVHPDGLVVMTQPQPEYGSIIDQKEEVAALLSLSPDDILNDFPMQAVSTGSSKLMIPLQSRERLFAINPDLSGMVEFSKKHSMRGFYPFTMDTVDSTADFHARMFNPLIGVNEDPLTGVAAGALGAYAVKYKVLPKNTFIIEQGHVLNKPGKMYVEIGNEVKVGGYAVTFGEKEASIKNA